MKYKCPCCGNITLSDEPPGTFEICPVCYWEDDDMQYKDPSFRGGANKISLNEASTNYEKFGAISLDVKDKVRLPIDEEKPV